jgi:hypothetical protein
VLRLEGVDRLNGQAAVLATNGRIAGVDRRFLLTDTVDKVGDGRDEAPDWSLLMVTVRLDSAP